MNAVEQLKALAQDLQLADQNFKKFDDERKALEREAIDALRVERQTLYEQVEGWKVARDKAEEVARGLIEQHRADTGETGSICDGMYQIITSWNLSLVDGCEMADAVRFVIEQMPLWRDHLTLDLKALGKAQEKAIKAMKDDGLPVAFVPTYGTRVMWSKLPEPETD